MLALTRGITASSTLAIHTTVLLLAAAACSGIDINDGLAEPIACGAAAVAHRSGAAFARAVGAPQPRALLDDSGELAFAVQGACVKDGCESRIAQLGTQIDVGVDVTELGRLVGTPVDGMRTSLESTNSEIIDVSHGSAQYDGCLGSWVVNSNVTFANSGKATLRVMHGAAVVTTFSFEVAQATSLAFTVTPGPTSASLQVEETEHGISAVRGGIDTGVILDVQARAPDGREMLLDNSVRATIDDSSIARFQVSETPDATRGTRLIVAFLRRGTTKLHATLGKLSTAIELHGDPTLPSPQLPAAGDGAQSL